MFPESLGCASTALGPLHNHHHTWPLQDRCVAPYFTDAETEAQASEVMGLRARGWYTGSCD